MKHGIEHRTNGGFLEIVISTKSDILQMIIKDNGIGRTASRLLDKNSTGIGLNVFSDFFELLNHYNDQHAGFEIEDLYTAENIPCGTQVTVFIPVSYQYLTQ